MKLVVVLGVHRSGTSLLTAGLEHLGCNLGVFEDHPEAQNPKGFFEHPDIRAFNDRLLAVLGASWDNWSFDARAEFSGPEFEPHRKEAQELLQTAFAGVDLAAVKDPRMSSLLPFWKAVFRETGLEPNYVLVLRHPAEVARSQAMRADGDPHLHYLAPDAVSMTALWCATTEILLREMPEEGAYLVSHADLLTDPGGVLRQLGQHLGLEGTADRIAQFASTFVDPTLYRARVEASNADEPLAALAAELHDTLVAQGANRVVTAAEARLLYQNCSGLALLKTMQNVVRSSFRRALERRNKDARRLSTLRQATTLFADIALRDGAAATLEAQAATLDQLVSRSGPDGDLLMLRQAVLAERLGDMAKARWVCEQLTTAFPDFAPGWVALLRLVRASGDRSAADQVLDQTRGRFPEHPVLSGKP